MRPAPPPSFTIAAVDILALRDSAAGLVQVAHEAELPDRIDETIHGWTTPVYLGERPNGRSTDLPVGSSHETAKLFTSVLEQHLTYPAQLFVGTAHLSMFVTAHFRTEGDWASARYRGGGNDAWILDRGIQLLAVTRRATVIWLLDDGALFRVAHLKLSQTTDVGFQLLRTSPPQAILDIGGHSVFAEGSRDVGSLWLFRDLLCAIEEAAR